MSAYVGHVPDLVFFSATGESLPKIKKGPKDWPGDKEQFALLFVDFGPILRLLQLF
jgi:hypothetical protein